jgi:hypothetical protein
VRKWSQLAETSRIALQGVAWFILFLATALFFGLPLLLALGATTPLAIGGALVNAPQELISQLARRTYAYAPTLVSVVAGAWFYLFAEAADLELAPSFFEVAAQIYPVLVLAAIVDVRRAGKIGTHDLYLTLTVLMGGEFFALMGVMRASLTNFALTSGALTAGFTALILSVLSEGPARTLLDRQPPGAGRERGVDALNIAAASPGSAESAARRSGLMNWLHEPSSTSSLPSGDDGVVAHGRPQ